MNKPDSDDDFIISEADSMEWLDDHFRMLEEKHERDPMNRFRLITLEITDKENGVLTFEIPPE